MRSPRSRGLTCSGGGSTGTGSLGVAMMADRPVVTGYGMGVQIGHSRGASCRFLIARSRSRPPGQVRASCQVMAAAVMTSISRAP